MISHDAPPEPQAPPDPHPTAELERRIAQLTQVMKSVEAGIWVLDEHGKTVMVNPAAERMTGWAAADLVGKISHTIIHHTRADGSPYPILECPIYKSVFHVVPAHVEGEVFWRKDGTSFPVVYTTTPVTGAHGEPLGAVQIFHEVPGGSTPSSPT